MSFSNDYENKFLKYLKNKNNFKDFYDDKDLFQRARLQLNSNRLFEENKRKEILNSNKKKLNKSCSANLIKVPHMTTFQRFQLLKEENANVIKRRSIYNNTNSLKPKKIDYFFQIKLMKKNRNNIKEYNTLFNKNVSRNKVNKNNLVILNGNNLECENNYYNENINNNNNESNKSFYNIYHSQSKRKLNRITLMKSFLKSTYNFYSHKKIDLKKIIIKQPDIKQNKSCSKINNPILKHLPIIQNINKVNI